MDGQQERLLHCAWGALRPAHCSSSLSCPLCPGTLFCPTSYLPCGLYLAPASLCPCPTRLSLPADKPSHHEGAVPLKKPWITGLERSSSETIAHVALPHRVFLHQSVFALPFKLTFW